MQSSSKGPKCKRPFSMDYRVQGSHARGVNLTQRTSRMRTARVMQKHYDYYYIRGLRVFSR